jgi:hypothetical protein
MPTFYRTVNNVTSTSTLDLAIGAGDFIDAYKSSKTLIASHVDVFQRSYYHVPTIFTFELHKANRRRQTHKKVLMYFRANWEKYQEEIIKAQPNINESNMNDMHKSISKCISDAASTSIPCTSSLNNRLSNFPKHIVELNRLKNYWQRKYTKSKDKSSKQNLEICRNDLIEEIEQHRCNQWQNFLDTLGPSPLSSAPFWRKINTMRGKHKKTNIGTIIVDGVKLTTDKEKADAFAQKLEKTFSNDDLNNFDQATKIEINKFFEDNVLETMFTNKSAPPITTRELLKCIKNSNSKTSLDVDNISNRMLKHLPVEMINKLVVLFNKCLTELKVPADWKTALVQMLTKKSNDASNINNYRPISITLCIARLFERVILGRLQRHLERNNVIIQQQSGFRHNRQTKDNLIALIQKSLEATSQGNKVISIFFDIASAFDKVWHKGLIFKLAKINTPYYIIKIIEDLLSNRTFRVKIEEYVTEYRTIQVGVPQGAVLSPTLFSIYINDVPLENKTNKSYTLLFADDIVHFVIYEDWSMELEREINTYLSRLETWMNKWRLSLAPHKCQYTIFTKNRRINTEHKFNLKLYGIQIPWEKNPIFLGITFDPYLSFNAHLEKTIEKAQSRLNVIKIISHYSTWRLNQDIQVKIYISLVRSLFEYMDFIYGIISQNSKDKMNAIENNCLRIIFNKKREECSVNDLHEMANIPKLNERLEHLREKYLDRNYSFANPILERLVEECTTYHNEILIDESLANEFFNINAIRQENKSIRKNVVNQKSTILSISKVLSGVLWPIETDASQSQA